MGKYAIICPDCGSYVEASTGLLAKRKLTYSCGRIIDTKRDKLTSRRCPHCGNEVLFDQSKGAAALCPICKSPINTMAEQSQLVEFSCGQCGVRHQVARTAETFTCPVCNYVNNVAERVKLEAIQKSGQASVIKYEGDNETLVWKHPIEDFTMGSQLIVHESQEAVFFRDGQALDLFGAGRYTLETQRLPILDKLNKLPLDPNGAFHSEVYFVNTATQLGVKWGTSERVNFIDPVSQIPLEIGASGSFNMRVADSRKLLVKVVGTTGGLAQKDLVGSDGKGFFRDLVLTQVQNCLADAIRDNNIDIMQISSYLTMLGSAMREDINPGLAEYGLQISEFHVRRVVLPEEDPNFQRLKGLRANGSLDVMEEQNRRKLAEAAGATQDVEAQNAARVKLINAQAEAEAHRLRSAAEAEEMRMKGYSYQQETARQVAMEAMQNGITGGSGGGLGDIAGLGVTLGTMGSVIGMTKDALNPVLEGARQAGSAAAGGWTCEKCGKRDIISRFCPECGAPKPEPNLGWTCPSCGKPNITSRFCPECGARKPEENGSWTCPDCGQTNITSKFCPECGRKRGE